jgi:integrase/recombinase XerC
LVAIYSRLMQSLLSPHGVYTDGDVDVALARVFGAGVRPLRLESAVFEAMLAGWRSQQAARYLKAKTVRANEVGVRRFQEHVGCWPWEWRASHVDEYFEDLLARPERLARSTLRAYQLRLKGFSEFVCDRRYPWVVICEREFGRGPGQLFGERNLVGHLDEFEGDPRRRPLTVDELELFFAACEARIESCRARGRKGSLQAWRDDAMFKVKFAWGLRRAELASLDLVDFRPHPKLPEFGAFGQVHVRWGKAKRGGGPQRRVVLSVFDWAVDVVEQYVAEVRPAFGSGAHPALFVTERGTRISIAYVNERFGEIRAEAGLDGMLTPHCLRHSYVTHLAELGWAAKFIQDQVGRSHAATTAIYMSVGDDFKDRLVRAAIDEQLLQLGGC